MEKYNWALDSSENVMAFLLLVWVSKVCLKAQIIP